MSATSLARILIAAGSDSGGGAGIQADIKTVTALGGYAATALTALTAQNTQGVFGVVGVEPAFIRQQMELVLDDIGADAIKTGMLHAAAVIEVIADVVRAKASSIPLVVDPVMVAKGGARLIAEDAIGALKAKLIARATIITPNLPEAEVLVGSSIATVDAMKRAAESLRRLGCAAVLLKGGHLDSDVVSDVLATAEGVEVFESARIPSRNTHGTGCTLASAIATGLGQRMTLRDAVVRARTYVRRAIEMAPEIGHGHGPLHHGHAIAPYKG